MSTSFLLLVLMLPIDGKVGWQSVLTLEPIPEDFRYFLQRPVSISIDERGYFFVLDLDAKTVFIWNESGVFQGSLGKPGKGPGEFDFSEWNYRQADVVAHAGEIMVYDGAGKQLHYFSSDGGFLRSVPFPGHQGRSRYFSVTGNGEILLSKEHVRGKKHPSRKAMLYDLSLQPIKTVAQIQEKRYERVRGKPVKINVFAPQLVVYADPASPEVLIGFGDWTRFEVYERGLTQNRVVAFRMVRRQVTASDREEFKRSPFLKQYSYVLAFPEWWPYYERILPHGEDRYLLFNVSPLEASVDGVMLDVSGHNLARIRYQCGENGGLFGSRGRLIAVTADEQGEFRIQVVKPYL